MYLYASLAVFGGAHAAAAGSPVQSTEDAAEKAWETYVAAATATPMPGTLSCAVSDGDDAMVATCFALVAAEDGSVASVIVGRSTSTDGVTWAEFVPVPVGASAADDAVANPAAGGFAMPDAVGIDLQQAQDLLQQVSGEVLYYSSSKKQQARVECS